MWQTFAEKLLCYSLLKKAPVLSLKGRYLFWKALDLLKNVLVFWGGILDLSAMISHTYAFIVLYVCVAPCGMYVKKRAFWYEIRHNVHKFIVKWCGGLQKRNSWVQKMGIIFYSIYNSVSLPCFPCWYFRKGGMGEWKIHIYRKDVYLAFCSWHFETSQISNPATNKATVGVCAIC